MFHRNIICWLAITLLASPSSLAHQTEHHSDNTAHYLGNEAVLVVSESQKVLFDPFFHKDFGFYQKVPSAMRQSIFKGEAPFNDIDIIVISHAHDDHFSARDVLKYMLVHDSVQLVAPKQAVSQLEVLEGAGQLTGRLHPIALAFGAAPVSLTVGEIQIEAVRIPHAGWPSRADVENMVFRLTFTNNATVMHMGDADPDTDHYLPFNAFWDKVETQLGFPPYWFLQSAEGNYILKDVIHVVHPVGVHVPVKIPNLLIKSGEDFFSKPGETRQF